MNNQNNFLNIKGIIGNLNFLLNYYYVTTCQQDHLSTPEKVQHSFEFATNLKNPKKKFILTLFLHSLARSAHYLKQTVFQTIKLAL